MPNLEGQELEDPDCVPLLEQSKAALAKGLQIVSENQVPDAADALVIFWRRFCGTVTHVIYVCLLSNLALHCLRL